MDSVIPPGSTPFGARVQRRLREEPIIWLTTMSADGTPQPNPIWFLWEDDTVLLYSLLDAARVRHIERNPRVSLNFDGNGRGGDIIVIAGEAHTSPDEPSADKNPAYIEKYRDFIARSFGTPERFAARYSLPIRIRITRVRGE